MLTQRHVVAAVLGASLLAVSGGVGAAMAGNKFPTQIDTILRNTDDAAAASANKFSTEPIIAPKVQPNTPALNLPGQSLYLPPPPVPPRPGLPAVRNPDLNGQIGGTVPLPTVRPDLGIPSPKPSNTLPNLVTPAGTNAVLPKPVPKFIFEEGIPKPGQSRDEIYGVFRPVDPDAASALPLPAKPKITSTYVDAKSIEPKDPGGIIYGQAPYMLDRSSWSTMSTADLNILAKMRAAELEFDPPLLLKAKSKTKRVVGGVVVGTVVAGGLVAGTIFGLQAGQPEAPVAPTDLPTPTLDPEPVSLEPKPTATATDNNRMVTITNGRAAPLIVFRALNTPTGQPWAPGLKDYQFEQLASVPPGKTFTSSHPAGTILAVGDPRYRFELAYAAAITVDQNLSSVINRRAGTLLIYSVPPGENSTFIANPLAIASGTKQVLNYPDGTTFLMAEGEGQKSELILPTGMSIELKY
jgi:hypothetical protein